MQEHNVTVDAECDTSTPCDVHHAKEGADEEARKSSFAPPAERRDHREWASAIKAYHYHLQHAVQDYHAEEETSTTVNSHDANAQGGRCNDVVQDLARWRAVLQRDAERPRQREYAAAMYQLATRFWDRSIESDDHPTNPHSTFAAAMSKRCADDMRCSTNEEQPQRHARQHATLRRCSDRVQLCLDSIQEYFLGEAVTQEGNSAHNNNNNNKNKSGALSSSPSPAGEVQQTACVYARLPLIFSRALKPLRRAFYARHGRMITPTELEQLLFSRWLDRPTLTLEQIGEHGEAHSVPLGSTVGVSCMNNDAWAMAALYARALFTCTQDAHACLPPFCALDIGSCYGPFFHRSLSHRAGGDTPLQVTAIDLQPYRPCTGGTSATACSSSLCAHAARHHGYHAEEASTRRAPHVWKGDWLTVSFYDRTESTSTASTINTNNSSSRGDDGRGGEAGTYYAEDGRLRIQRHHTSNTDTGTSNSANHDDDEEDVVCGVAAGAYDAVLFCLLLSYLPTARLRYLACLHAYLALKPHGLLVILSTRTQGSRRKDWIEDWVRCMHEIGFSRVHKQLCEKLVLLTFAKTPAAVPRDADGDGGEARQEYDLQSADGRAAWLAAKMQANTAGALLYITADDVH